MTTDLIDKDFNGMQSLDVSRFAMHMGPAAVKARNLRISLKQWKMFHAVIDADGFFGAADSLNVTQSTISHAVAKLQDQLGVPLLVLKGRKAEITNEGRILLERSRHLIKSAMELEELADHLKQGWGPEIRLVTDPSFPADLLTLALRQCVSAPQKIRLSVKQSTHEQTRHALHHDTVDLAISSRREAGFVGKECIDIEHVAVTHPASVLLALKRDITSEELRTQCQVALSGFDDYVATDATARGARFGQVWNVSSLDRAIAALRQSVGYAWLPRHQVQQALDDNQVRILPLVGGSSYRSSLYLLYGRSLAPDSVAGRFAELLRACSMHYQAAKP